MTVRLSLPVIGKLPGDAPTSYYADQYANVVAGRAFMQDLSTNDANAVIDGAEVWLRAGTAASALFACCDGLVTLLRPPNRPARLRLTPDVYEQWRMNRFDVVEPRPTCFVYVNVDPGTFSTLIVQLGMSVKDEPLHPLMLTRKGKKTLFERVQDAAPPSQQDVIRAFVEETISGGRGIPVAAGDRIGEAGTVWVTNAGYPAPTPPADFAGGSARIVVFQIEDHAGLVRDPRYDLARWMDSSLTSVEWAVPPIDSNGNQHPFLATLLNPEGALVRARPITNPTTRLNPISASHLTSYHCFGPAVAEWRIRPDNGHLQVQAKQTNTTCEAPRPRNQPGDLVIPNLEVSRATEVTQMWNSYGVILVKACAAFQVPLEVVIAFIGTESRNRPRAIRFEGRNPRKLACHTRRGGEPTAGQDALADELFGSFARYEVLRDRWHALFPAKDAMGRPRELFVPPDEPPEVWSDDTVIHTSNGVQMTWGEAFELISMSSYFAMRVSSGLMQTLIGTAQKTAQRITQWYPDIAKTLGVNNASWEDFFFASNQHVPNSSGAYVRWLAVPAHSIVIGTAYLKDLYGGSPLIDECEYSEGEIRELMLTRRSHRWDPPKIAGAYNAGQLMRPKVPEQPKESASQEEKEAYNAFQRWGIWGITYSDDYMARFGPFFNSAIDHLNNANTLIPPEVATLPTVRLKT
jgi:hypothetical protein